MQVDNSEVTDELRHQLEETQHELARVQAQQRKKNKRADPNITESEAVTTLQFIRASLFQVGRDSNYSTSDSMPRGIRITQYDDNWIG